MFSDMVLRTIRAPESKQAMTLLVAVRCRPIGKDEKDESRNILRVLDDKVVLVLDPDVSKEYLDRVQNRSKERKYAFDIAFGGDSTNRDVYGVTIGSMVEGVVRGLNATVFAYGATGSGKTHTMAGTPEDPGLMVLSLQTIFHLIVKQETEYEFDVTCSYLEVYNEVIYDLLEPKSGHLELREDPDQGITVAGLKRIQVTSAEKILELLHQGNSRRKTESTDANATSSRSHAVLEIIVKRKQRNQYRAQVLRGKLALVDLAGSERASETNNAGQKLRDGANINRSLLALANCINALGKHQKKGLAYVPYRNSKLTRLLKDGLSGNSRTVMVATVSSGDHQYHQTINTLKYADRAKEIKTHIKTNVGTVDAHVADYQRMIDNLQVEVSKLRRELAEKESQLTAKSSEARVDDELSWLDVLSHDINENVEERINLQKALFELEDTNVHNRAELQHLDDSIAEALCLGKEIDNVALKERRQVVLDNIRDNDEAGARYREEIEQNEEQRKELQRMIDDAISSDRNKTFLRILSQYRLLGMTNMELQFQMAVRDQIIQDQREALSNLWLVLECSGLNRKQILKIAAQQGIVIEEGIVPARRLGSAKPTSSLYRQQSRSPAAAARHSNPTSPDVGQLKESRGWTDFSSRDENDSFMNSNSPRTSIRDWRNTRGAENGSNCPKWNNTNRAQTGRSKFQSRTANGVPAMDGNGHCDGWHSPQNSRRGIETHNSRERFSFPGASSRTSREQTNNSLPEGRGRSPPLAVQGPNTPVRQKRRPRSSESQLRHSKWGSERGNGREKESTIEDGDRSEDSGLEEDPGNRSSWSGSRHSDKTGPLDSDMLRKELSRLDTELQDLKRGMDVNSAMRWESNNPTISPHLANGGELPGQNHRSSTPLFGGVKPILAHNGTPRHSGFVNVDEPHGKGENNGNHMYRAPYGFGRPSTWNSSRGWLKAGALDSGLSSDANGSRAPPAFDSGEVLEGRQSMSPKMKAIIERRKFRIEGSQAVSRQIWPCNTSDGNQSSS